MVEASTVPNAGRAGVAEAGVTDWRFAAAAFAGLIVRPSVLVRRLSYHPCAGTNFCAYSRLFFGRRRPELSSGADVSELAEPSLLLSGRVEVVRIEPGFERGTHARPLGVCNRVPRGVAFS